MGRKKKETTPEEPILPKEKKLSFEHELQEEEESRLKVKPEDFVRYREDNNALSPECNPYGEGYIIPKSVFLGDHEPYDQFGDGKHRRWEVINDGDPDLIPVYFSLPEPPKDKTLIHGYGLPPDEQYFRRLEIPRKFKLIEQKALLDLSNAEKRNRQETVQGYKLYTRFWEIVEEEQENLEDELQWLRHVWWWRTYGYWYYNDGEEVFLPPDYFDFLNFYYIEEAVCYPEYRDDVRRKYCYAMYLENSTETFKNLDDTGLAIPNEDGTYEMIDLGRRIFFGDVEPKTRRTGATHEAIHKILKGTMTYLSFFSTIISFEGDNARVHYEKKLLPAFDAYPMCLKPIWEGSRRPSTLRLSPPANVYSIKGLNSTVTYSDSGGLFKNDGDRLNGVVNDEQGKRVMSTADIFERWHVNKFTMSTGMGVNILKGVYVKNPSTVEEMESESTPYKKMCELSNFYKRIPVKGQTLEGFARIFLPAYRRMEGYIDRFGKSVIDTPTERQKRLSPDAIFAVSGKGARETMQAERDALLAIDTPEAHELYRSIRRKSPFTWAECWLGAAGNVGYNMEIIDSQLSKINKLISLGKAPYRIGNFYRQNGDPDGDVLWEDEPIRGKFRLSLVLPPSSTNRRTKTMIWDGLKQQEVPTWTPIDGHRFTVGCDPFRNLKATEAKSMKKMGVRNSNSRQSDGGIAVLWEHDAAIDRDKEIFQWETHRCVCSYRNRPLTQRDYFEDVLMCAQYFGGLIYPEQNVERFIEHMFDRGYGGYGLYDIDMVTGKMSMLPGKYNGPDVNQSMVREYKDYIETRGMCEVHDDLLNETKSFKGIEDFTRLDLKTAFGMCLLGSKSRYRQFKSNQDNAECIDLSGVFMKRQY